MVETQAGAGADAGAGGAACVVLSDGVARISFLDACPSAPEPFEAIMKTGASTAWLSLKSTHQTYIPAEASAGFCPAAGNTEFWPAADNTELSMDMCGECDDDAWPTVGSRGHPYSCQRACKFVRRNRGCKEGAGCPRCHLCIFTREGERVARGLAPRGWPAPGGASAWHGSGQEEAFAACDSSMSVAALAAAYGQRGSGADAFGDWAWEAAAAWGAADAHPVSYGQMPAMANP